MLEATDLVKRFVAPDGRSTAAVAGVSFTLHRGETLGIVGESGSGKSTTARIALALERADEGEVRLLGQPWSSITEAKRRALRPRIGVVYQDPLSSFDPRWNTERILLDAIGAGPDRRQRDHRVSELLAQVSLAVVAMFAAGLLMMLLRRWGGHVATPALAHLATNSLGVLIAWWLVSAH